MTIITNSTQAPWVGNPPDEEELVKWYDMDWRTAVQNLTDSDNEDVLRESAKRVYEDLGPTELGTDRESWVRTFIGYNWDGVETLEQALWLFGGQK